MSVAAQHFPILVPSDKCDLFNGEPSLEKAARAFVTQIVKVEVFYLKVFALTAKRSADRASVIRENSAVADVRKPRLLVNDLPRVCTEATKDRKKCRIVA